MRLAPMLAILVAAPAFAAPPRATLWLGGDVHLGAGGHAVLAPIAPLTVGARGIVNLEGAVAEGEAARRAGKKLELLNAPSSLGELARAGVRVVGVANNHAGDAGDEGRAATVRAARAAGLLAAGGPAGPALLVDGGLRIVVTAHDLEHGVPRHLADELAAARRLGDVLIATFHVTAPASYLPRPELRAAVDIALAQGAILVAAHGTHAIGPVERRGRALIAWGLGNLAFACDCTDETDALLLRVTLSRDGVDEACVLPVDAGVHGAAARPSLDARGVLDLVESLGSRPTKRAADRACF